MYFTGNDTWKIKLTEEELLAIKYIHGEGNDYCKTKRVMNKLSAFCHACDVFSARVTFDKNKIEMRYSLDDFK